MRLIRSKVVSIQRKISRREVHVQYTHTWRRYLHGGKVGNVPLRCVSLRTSLSLSPSARLWEKKAESFARWVTVRAINPPTLFIDEGRNLWTRVPSSGSVDRYQFSKLPVFHIRKKINSSLLGIEKNRTIYALDRFVKGSFISCIFTPRFSLSLSLSS